ncbi:MAG: tetratricopeptide repeat protein [Nannocystaceae bacterium]|nr:tetratricopeptide repeat protein [Nannocystaceae bacterium]
MTGDDSEPSASRGQSLEDTEALGVSQTRAGASDEGRRRARLGAGAMLARGRSIGRYVIVDRLGSGGMGVVYRAFDPDLDRSIALKLVAVERDGGDDERNRLLREAQAMARVSHPNVIPVFDVGVEEDLVFVAMELVDGVTLSRWCTLRPRTWSQRLACFLDAGAGLAAAHAAGLIHRDFKPDNVMVGPDAADGTHGRVRVLDFGLARHDASTPARSDEATAELRVSSQRRAALAPSLDQAITAAGAVMGTPAYMSPEQHLGAPATAASDQFSFCVAVWEALYGERPFEGDTLASLSLAVLQGKLREPPGGSGVPRHVHAALLRGLANDDARRHPSMAALLEALRRDPQAQRRRRLLVAAGGIGLLAGGVALGTGVERTRATTTAASVELCAGGDAILAKVWHPERAERLARAFAATGLSYATPVWHAVAAQLDDYGNGWIAARTAACTATRVTGEQSEAMMDLRMACLDRRRRELDALLVGFATPDDAVVERAIDAARGLPPVASCDRPARGAEDAADPTVRASEEAVRAALPYVRAAIALGHFTEARLRVAPLAITAGSLGRPALSAEVARWTAEVDDASGRPDDARAGWEHTFAQALAADDPELAAEAAGELTHAVGYRRADLRGGQTWLDIGRALVQRLGGAPERTAALDADEGAMLVAAGRYADAIVAHRRALAYWSEHAPEGLQVARTLDDIGAAQVQLGQLDEAIASHQRAIAIRTTIYGDQHPLVADSERELGMALSGAGRFDEAAPHLQRALAVQRATRGERSIAVATLLDDLGRIARRKGDLAGALAHHREALTIWEAALGEQHQDVAVSLLGIGYTLVAAGQPAEAARVDARALAVFERSLGAKHPYIVYAANALGAAYLSAGEPQQAIAPLERALALRGQVEVDPTLFGDTLFALAKARLRNDPRRNRTDAIAAAREARALFATAADRWASEIAEIDAWLAAPR